MSDVPPLPAPPTLDRAGLERVIARAAELAARAGDTPETVTEEQAVSLGTDVGIPAQFLREALAEERTRVVLPEEPSGWWGRFGPTQLSTSRTISGRPDQILAELDRYMQREETLRVKRQFGDRITWEARRDLVGSIKRGFNFAGRAYILSRVAEVGATVVAVDDNRVMVRLDADIARMRREVAGWSIAMGVLGVGGGAGFLTLAALSGGSLIIAGVIGGGVALAGSAGAAGLTGLQRRFAARVLLGLEQVLDHLERGGKTADSVLSVLGALRAIR
jgi:hypothetical protein